MTLSPSARRFALTTHVTSSVGWLGALAVFLAHAAASVGSDDAFVVRAACVAMGVTAWFVIFPLSLASLVTGLIQALGTAWGLFKHYWVLAKLALTSLATAVLLLKLAPIDFLATAAASPAFAAGDHQDLRVSMLIHAIGGLVVLLAVVTLAIYKPTGLTRYGLRKLREQRGSEVTSASAPSVPLPLWVKGFIAVILALTVMMAIMMLFGEHGPRAHM